MTHWITEHLDAVSGAAGATVTIVVDTIHGYASGEFTHVLLHDGNVIAVALILLVIKSVVGAFVGVFVGNWVAKYSKNKEQ